MSNLIFQEKIENKIYLIRGKKVMLDSDLAEFYGVETRVLNQAIKRNMERFPKDFMFQLDIKEKEIFLRSQIVILEKGKYSKYLPYVFTEHGILMLSSVLKSKKAVEINIAIMRIFVKIRKFASNYKELAEKINQIEKEYGTKINKVFTMLDELFKQKIEEKKNKREIGFKID